MLQGLFIKNIGLITEMEIDLRAGLNVLTGETGAGKSIIINSVNFLCGKKFDKMHIRKNCDDAIIEGSFYINNESEKKSVSEFGIDVSDDNLIIISRRYISGKIVNRINGHNISIGMLREISEKLIEFHGQSESQMLFNKHKHLEILDRFCENETLKKILVGKIKKLHESEKIINDLIGQTDLENKIMLLEFQIKEIEEANLISNEEEKLRDRYKILSNAKNIYEKMAQVMNLVYESDFSARDIISRSNQLYIEIKNTDEDQKDISNTFSSILIYIDEMRNEIVNNLSEYEQTLQNSSKEMDDIEKRLDFLYELKLKYKKNTDEIIEYGSVLFNRLEELKQSSKKIKQIQDEIKLLENEIDELCEKISQIRKKTAESICVELEKNLADLSMPDAEIKIDISRKNNFDGTGYDNAKFLISANLGEDFKPIDKISSGGEASRIMLAIETVFAGYNNIPTIIFDEIDSGVSGKVAQMVAEKLNLLSRNCQVICITHLAQIAAMADTHFLIKKIYGTNFAETKIFELDKQKSIYEIARILSGKKITDITLESAREIKNGATNIKLRFKN